jgi:iron complex outermembrane receptor protein
VPTAALAQSTGTIETEKDTIVVTGTRAQRGIDGIVIQDSTKAKGLVNQEYIESQSPGQSLLNSINYIPGVNFTQSDPYGSSGGNLRIRGFDGNRVSVTFDGVPLNDSGNYAIFANQLLDPELIEQINVNLGATDVDSPTASAAGGTVNFRSITPLDRSGVQVVGSAGTFDFRRALMLVHTGRLTSFGTKAWLSGSHNRYDHWRGNGKIDKWQVNSKVYQPLGDGGDFVSVAAHYNQNRNNNYNNPNLSDLRTLFTASEIPTTIGDSPLVIGDFSDDQWDDINDIAYPSECRDAAGVAIVRNGGGSDPTTCFTPEGPFVSQGSSNLLGLQINPSNTGNLRGQSRITLLPDLVLTVDPTFQYVLANGGSQSVRLSESDELLRQGIAGATGVDLNGDGDVADSIIVGRPSVTNTRRATVISSLVWKPDATNTFRVAYTFDRARHRQTGEYTRTNGDFTIANPFFGRNGDPIITAAGTELQNRDRLSVALLHQLSGQYIGRFVDDRLRVELGLRSPWFTRELDQRCYTPVTGAGFPVCAVNPEGITPNPYTIVDKSVDPTTAGSRDIYAPFDAEYKYHKLLPNLGTTFAVTESLSVFGSYAKGLSAPRTDNLYRSPFIGVRPETTDSFDLGARYITRAFQAQGTLWKIGYQNRIVTSFDPETNTSIDRNVGKVSSWGFDGGLGVRPIPQLNLIGLASYTNAELRDDILIGTVNYNSASPPTTLSPFQYYCGDLPTTGTAPVRVCGQTKGKFVVETPKWQVGGRAEVDFAPFTFGIQAKRVGRRFATDVNDVVVKGYTLVDLDARVALEAIAGRKTFLQLNVINLLNERYFGNLSTTINAFGTGSSAPRFTPAASRAVTGTLSFGF